jgi:hypothetical protein
VSAGDRYCPRHGLGALCTCRGELPTLDGEEAAATPLRSPPPTDPSGAPVGAELDAMLSVGRMRASCRAALDALDEGDVARVRHVLEEVLAP